MVSKLWSDSGRLTVNALIRKSTPEDPVPQVCDDQPLNVFNEIRILMGHRDIINILKIIDDVRLASSADDNLVIIWDIENGDQLHCLQGHTRPVTSMLVHQQNKTKDQEYVPVLITGSSDKTIRCLINIYQDFMFCSGGEDLCLWDVHGHLLSKERQPNPDADVHTILPIKGDKLVIAFSKPSLVVYSVNDVSQEKMLNFHCQLDAHREDVRCLINVSDESFASASLDGEIITWSSQSLEPIKKFNKIKDYEGVDHVYPYSVQHMFAVDQRFIFAAVGSGFSLYDSVSGERMATRKNAHHSKVSHVELLKESVRCMLATCSEDGTVRLWGSSNRYLPGEFSHVEQFLGKSLAGETQAPIMPELLGECLGHSGSVRMIAYFADEGFASCATDGLIILWKNGLHQRRKRMELATNLLLSPS